MSFIVDGHTDAIWAALKQGRSLGSRSETGHVDFPRLQEAGVGIQVFALFADPQFRWTGYVTKILTMIDALIREIDANSDRVGLATSLTQAEAIVQSGRTGVLMSIEGGEAIGESVAVLRTYYRMGVRAMGLTWNHRNALADGTSERHSGGGLTELGKDVVREMMSLSMMVDVSHLSEAGFWDVEEMVSGPFIASHSNAQGVCDHPRNLTDDQIRALARHGGLMGINFAPAFVKSVGTVGCEDLVDHIDYIAKLVGVDYIGLGSDYDGIASTPVDMPDVTALQKLAGALERRGYPRADVDKIMGGNFRRVLREVLG